MYEIYTIEAFEDNYIYVLHNQHSAHCVVIDPGDIDAIEPFLEYRNVSPSAILITHHHGDHVGAVGEVHSQYHCPVYGPPKEADLIPNCDHYFTNNKVVSIGGLDVHAIETIGHTKGHVALYMPQIRALFSGDTLFALGCGRLFEGTAGQMWHSLKKLRDLPDDTMVYPGHEYTLTNAAFTQSVPVTHPPLLDERIDRFQKLRNKKGRPTIPVNLGEEKKTNLFLRADEPELIEYFNARGPVDCFTHLRRLRDKFKADATMLADD